MLLISDNSDVLSYYSTAELPVALSTTYQLPVHPSERCHPCAPPPPPISALLFAFHLTIIPWPHLSGVVHAVGALLRRVVAQCPALSDPPSQLAFDVHDVIIRACMGWGP